MTGATGFIGSQLTVQLLQEGHSLVLVTRDVAAAQRKFGDKPEFIECDLNKNALSTSDFKNVQAVINLAGESIQGRWTAEKKSRIMQSRTNVAQNLLKNIPPSVKTLITVSAQGIYGDRSSEELTEESSPGEGFLAEVCKAWEAQFQNVPSRLVILRLGMVLAPEGGALKKLLSLFRKNLGAVLGDGRQWMSCISLHDLIRILSAALTDENYVGVINAVNESPVTNDQFTKLLCKKLDVLQLPRVPAFFLKAALGEMSDLVLSSLKVYPRKLNELGFKFADPKVTDIFNRYLD